MGSSVHLKGSVCSPGKSKTYASKDRASSKIGCRTGVGTQTIKALTVRDRVVLMMTTCQSITLKMVKQTLAAVVVNQAKETNWASQ